MKYNFKSGVSNSSQKVILFFYWANDKLSSHFYTQIWAGTLDLSESLHKQVD